MVSSPVLVVLYAESLVASTVLLAVLLVLLALLLRCTALTSWAKATILKLATLPALMVAALVRLIQPSAALVRMTASLLLLLLSIILPIWKWISLMRESAAKSFLDMVKLGLAGFSF